MCQKWYETYLVFLAQKSDHQHGEDGSQQLGDVSRLQGKVRFVLELTFWMDLLSPLNDVRMA